MTGLTRLPPWAAALVTVTAVLLLIYALPRLATGAGPDERQDSTSSRRDTPPEPLPLTKPDAKGRDVPSDEGVRTPRGPLPVAGGSALPPLALGLGLLGGGVGLLYVIGFTGERPWPGRYVRRIG